MKLPGCMKASLAFTVLILLLAQGAGAEDRTNCWKKALVGNPSSELHCLAADWEEKQDSRSLRAMIDALFYVYLTDADHPVVRQWVDGLRRKSPRYLDAIQLRIDLIHKYTFPDFQAPETAAVWAMVPPDARALFVLTLDGSGNVPGDIRSAMHLAVYDEIERYFLLAAAPYGKPGVLPVREYERLEEVLEKMVLPDPFLFAVNQYYQGIVCMSHSGFSSGQNLVEGSRAILRTLILTSADRVARRRILRQLALADVVLGNEEDARREYVALLRIDPQDWTVILQLSYLLNETGECSQSSIWVEASLPSRQELFDITIHCGSQELPEETFPTENAVITDLLNMGLPFSACINSDARGAS